MEDFINEDGQEISLIYHNGPDSEKGANSLKHSMNACPKGWKIPSKADFTELIEHLPKDPKEQVDFLNYGPFETDFYSDETKIAYITTDEADQWYNTTCEVNNTKGKYGVSFGKVYDHFFATRVIANSAFLLSKNPKIVQKGKTTSLKCYTFSSVNKYKWDMGDSTKLEGPSVNHTSNSYGRTMITLTIEFSDGTSITQKSPIWTIEILEEDMIVGETNYGRPMIFGSQIWLNKDLEFYTNYKGEKVSAIYGQGPNVDKNGEWKGGNSFRDIKDVEIEGLKIPSKDDFEILLNFIGKDLDPDVISEFFYDKKGFNINPNYKLYVSTSMTKVNNIDYFEGLEILTNKASFANGWSYDNYLVKFATRLIIDTVGGIDVGIGKRDVFVGEEQ